jgi:hypothetical protein
MGLHALFAAGVIVGMARIAVAQGTAGQSPLSAIMDGGRVEFRYGDEVVLRYRATPDSRKQYVEELRTPNGVSLLADAPPDHPWHHGMMLALIVDGVNYWEEPRADSPPSARFGRQQLASDPVAKASDSDSFLASVTHDVLWQDGGGSPQLTERRTVAVAYHPQNADLLLTWQSELAVAGEAKAVELAGTHYHGVGLRFRPEFTGSVEVLLPDAIDSSQVGQLVRGSEVVYSTVWCGYHARLQEGAVTVVMFAAPHEPDPPTRWFTMDSPFTFLSATLGLDKQSLRLATGKPLTLTYGLAAWDRQVDTEQIVRAYHEWQSQLGDLSQ